VGRRNKTGCLLGFDWGGTYQAVYWFVEGRRNQTDSVLGYGGGATRSCSSNFFYTKF
jgi:hypothetical protein